MKEYSLTDLTYLSTEQLDEILQAETVKPVPDDDLVLRILRILEEREKDFPLELTPGEEAAFKKYRESVGRRKRKLLPLHRWVSAVASVAVIAGFLITMVPQRAEAETFWEMLQRWSNTVLSYFSGEGMKAEIEYTFKTDNPGLQQVYDAVVELGVTEPVVPMWLPEKYEIAELDSQSTPMVKGIFARFTNDNGEIVYKLDVYGGEPAHQYYKDDTHYESYERNGTTYNITRNNDRWVVVWTKDNIECLLTLDCQEDTLRRILESIYVMEDD